MLLNQTIIQNFDIIVLTCEALDVEITQEITSYRNSMDPPWPLITSFDIFQIRHNDKLRVDSYMKTISLSKITNLIYIIKNIITQKAISNDILALVNHSAVCSENTFSSLKFNDEKVNNFYKRFRFLFRKYLDEQAVGVVYYQNDDFLNQIAITNVYILFLLSKNNGYDHFWSYLYTCNYFFD